jgi:hypothetical protein
MAEFEIQRSDWSEKEKILRDGYSVIEDMLDGASLSFCCRLLAASCRWKPSSDAFVFF